MRPKRVYFDGCSWTRGAELEHPEEERYSRLLSEHFDFDELNLGKSGGSNDRIVRNLIAENNIVTYDLAIIQMTLPARTEFYYDHEKKWIRINPQYNYSSWLNDPPWNNKNLMRVDERVKDNSSALCPLCGTKTQKLSQKFVREGSFWHDYYRVVTSEKYFDTKEYIQFQTIKNHCEVNEIPLILCTINQWTNLDFDLQFNIKSVPKAPKGHPNKEGHRIIANELIKLIDKI